MSERKRLILHIGTYKTGSTSLQSLMAAERDALAARGFCYPLTDRPPEPNIRKHKNLRAALLAGPDAFAAERATVMKEFAESGADTLVLSDEALSEHSFGKYARMREFAQHFELEVVCFLRRQDYFIESFWNQRCKRGLVGRHIHRFALAPYTSCMIDYLALLDFWAGFARITAIGFEQACEKGLVESFNEATGLDLPPETRKRNVSPDMRTAAIMAALNRHGVAANWREIDASLSGPRQRHALGARLRAEILARCAEQNAALARRHGVHFPDDMPEEPEEPLPKPGKRMLARLHPQGRGAR